MDKLEMYKIGDIFTTYTGLSGKNKKDFINGNKRYISYTNIYNNPSVLLNLDDFVNVADDEKQNEIKYKDVLVAGSSENLEDSGMIAVVDIEPSEKIYLNSFCFGMRLKDEYYDKYDIRFLKHLFRSKKIRDKIVCCSFGVTRYNLSKERFFKIEIPCPSIEIQKEIVKLLEKFREYDFSMKDELRYRRIQYKHYLQNIISSVEGDEMMLDDLLDYIQPTKYLVKSTEYDSKNDIPVLTAGQTFILGYTDEKEGVFNASHSNPVIIFDDFTTSNHWVDFDFKVKSSAMKMLKPKKNTNVNFKYIYYCMQNIDYAPQEHTRQWIQKYSKFRITIPNIEKQNEIVKILDIFEQYINDSENGLLGEINYRTKQYNYYKDILLDFERSELV